MNTSINAFYSRQYEREQDLEQMLNLLVEGRAHTSDWRYAHVGELLWNFFMVACHLNPRDHIRLWHDAAVGGASYGKLAGYAILGEDPSFDCQVLPEYAGSGIESQALVWAGKRLAELRKGTAQAWPGYLKTGARQDDAQRIAFLGQQGFRRGGYAEINFLRSLEDTLPEPSIPAGYQVRPVGAGASEISYRAAAQRQVWQPWTVGKVGDEDYVRLMRLPGYYPDLDVVAVTPDGVIAAYVNGWIDPVNRIGDFGPVGALSAYRRQGLTRAVLLECMRRMQAHGMDRVCVSTGEGNTAAIRLYESIGFMRVNSFLEYERAG